MLLLLHLWFWLLRLWIELLVVDVVQLFENVYQHRLFSFYTCFVSVSHEVHVYFSGASLLLVLFLRPVEGVFFVKLVEVFVGSLILDSGLVRSFFRPHFGPVKTFEERVLFNFVYSVLPQTVVSITNHFLQNVN